MKFKVRERNIGTRKAAEGWSCVVSYNEGRDQLALVAPNKAALARWITNNVKMLGEFDPKRFQHVAITGWDKKQRSTR